jgi:CubicO group peptidase (beta-lactamase class C family)
MLPIPPSALDALVWCDMAKIGQLVLDRGRWNGTQVVSETWINAATAPQIKTIYRGLDYVFNSGLAPHLFRASGSIGWKRRGKVDNES